jgi:hypothetical protein
MTINGTNIENYGLVVISQSGFLNMPSRIQPVAYDWGDEIEPFVSADQIGWEGQQFTVDCIHDPRRGGTVYSAISTLESMEEVVVGISGSTGNIGEHNCQILSINNHVPYSNADRIKINFYNRVPSFNAAVPGSKNGGSSSFDGYSFSQFGIKPALRKDFASLNALKSSTKTTYLQGGHMSQYRALKRVGLDCYLIGSSNSDRIQKMESFKTVLSTEGLKEFVHMGQTFPKTFLSDGFNVRTVGTKVLKFTMYLNVVP